MIHKYNNLYVMFRCFVAFLPTLPVCVCVFMFLKSLCVQELFLQQHIIFMSFSGSDYIHYNVLHSPTRIPLVFYYEF